ncbi:hypothetical protein OG373_02720 [Streptomyces avidinii]|nr:hypothetical protein OG373_02720 [Streptomyces avidinii]
MPLLTPAAEMLGTTQGFLHAIGEARLTTGYAGVLGRQADSPVER